MHHNYCMLNVHITLYKHIHMYGDPTHFMTNIAKYISTQFLCDFEMKINFDFKIT